MMCKSKKFSNINPLGMPKAPWIYVADPAAHSQHGRNIARLIPGAIFVLCGYGNRNPNSTSPVVFAESLGDSDNSSKMTRMRKLKEIAINHGHNFVSINIMKDTAKLSKNEKFGGNHLNIVEADNVPELAYKWLFTVLTVREQLHLIPEDQMKKTDTQSFGDYAYCPIKDSRSHPKNAKIQFVVLILDKPQVKEGKRLTWSVADRTGVANFYFQHRGESSQYTWDWVLNLKPGQRCILPRMPMVEVKEKKRARLAKAPLRVAAMPLIVTGLGVKALGKGLHKIGSVMQTGSATKWVPEADIGADGKPIDWSKVKDPLKPEKKTIDVFNEKGERNWSDTASAASTDVASAYDEKSEKGFL